MERTLASDIVSFAEALYTVDRAWLPDGDGGWKVARNRPIVLLDWQRAQLRGIFPPENGGRPVVRNYLDSECKKLGKSTKAGIVAAYMAATEPGGEVYVCAADKDQAKDRVFRSIKYAVEHGPLGDFATAYRDRIDWSNGATIQAFAMDYKGAAGGEPVCVVFDELHTYSYESERRLWDEFIIPPTLPYGIRWVSSYAGFIAESVLLEEVWKRVEAGEQVQEWPPEYRNDAAGWWGMILQGEEAYELVPWGQGERGRQYLAEARASERAISYRRLFRNEWVEGLGDFCDLDDWLALVDPEHRPLPPGSPEAVYVGLDLATGPKGDDCALAAVYWDAERQKTALAFHRIWKGRERRERLKLGETVKPYLLRLAQHYELRGIFADPWQGQLLSDELSAAGLWVVQVPQSHASRGPKDTALYQMIADRTLILYDHPEVRKATLGASAKELPDGRLFLTKTGSRIKIDLLVALSNCADEAKEGAGYWYLT